MTVAVPSAANVNALATYSASITPSINERLASVSFTFPANTDLAGVSTATIQAVQGAVTVSPASVNVAGRTLTATFANRNWATTPLTVRVSNVRSASQPGGYSYTAQFTDRVNVTASGTGSYELTANPSAPVAGAVSAGSNVVSTPSAYTLSFTVGPQGRIASDAAAGPNMIYVDFPAGFVLPSSPSLLGVTINGVQVTSGPVVSGRRVTVAVPPNVVVPAGGTATIEFPTGFGIINPSVPGAYSFGVSTSAESGVGTSPPLQLAPLPDTTPPFTTLVASPATAGGQNGWYTEPLLLSFVTDESSVTYYHWDADGDGIFLAPFFAPEGSHVLRYHSVDASGNIEAQREATALVDLTEPPAPSVSPGSVTTSTVDLSWGAVDDGQSGLAYYEVYEGASLLATTTGTSHTVTGLAAATSYSFTVKAVDVAGWTSVASTPVSVTTPEIDTTAPTTALSVSPPGPDGTNAWYVTSPTVSLSSSEPGITYFAWDSDPWRVYGLPLAASEGTHTIRYYSIDSVGNTEGEGSRTFQVDTSAPGTPTLSATLAAADAVQLDWTAVTDVTSGVSGYRVTDVGTGSTVATTTGLSATLTGLPGGVTKTYRVQAFDVAGNTGAPSNDASVTTPAPQPLSLVDPPTGVRVDFFSATDPGVLTVQKVAPGHALPSNLELLGDLCFDVSATTAYTGDFLVTIPYNPALLGVASESVLRLLKWENGQWRDITVGRDAENHTVTARTSSFGQFALLMPTGGGEPVETPASTGWSLAIFSLIGLAVAAARLKGV